MKVRGAKMSMENLRGAKICVENLRGKKNFHHFPKNTPTAYPDLKKTGPLIILVAMRGKNQLYPISGSEYYEITHFGPFWSFWPILVNYIGHVDPLTEDYDTKLPILVTMRGKPIFWPNFFASRQESKASMI